MIELVADNNQHFKTRATSAIKGVYEVAPSESTIRATSLVEIAAMLKEIKEGQQMNAFNCKKTTLLQHLTISMRTSNRHIITHSIIHSLKGGVTTHKIGGTYLNNHNKPNSANHTHIANPKVHKTQDTNHLMLDKAIHHQMLLHPTMKKPFELISKINPKGGINMVHNEVAQEEEEVEEEEIVEKQDEEETFFIATIFGGGPLKKSKEVFTMVDASIVSMAGIAENVLVKVEGLTIPADFHIIMPIKGDKGGRPQGLLGDAYAS
ncbi:hypothetical protein PIB30_092490 [Stylosanthes scabra]|uniref:Uncharacterized protein n=1 Tax=Stylosanthes scabra TaxID=79078 RepID=A0ABU6WT75_9FABA|nr:hypothetical protein [Stylosanthes scabra]